jgi:hypothetical protein
MNNTRDTQNPNAISRRRLLWQLAAIGALSPAGISGFIRDALAKGDIPTIPGVNALQGTATVNGSAAKVGAPVKPGDRVATGKASQAVVVVDGDAFLLRENTSIGFKQSSGALETVQIVTGKILSVFAKRRDASRLQAKIPTGTIGIRGTGMYLEVEEKRTYFCLCYGEAAIEGGGMEKPFLVATKHHESPLWLYDNGGIMKVEPGPFLNHSDAELIMLEALVGREPPFKGQPYPLNKY